jgi:hypothetical protein
MALFALLLLGGPQPAAGFLGEIVLNPQHPTPSDQIELRIHGWLPNQCWKLVGFSLQELETGSYLLSVLLLAHQGYCIAIPVDYHRTYSFEPLETGTYSVQVIESMWPLPGWQIWNSIELVFQVSPSQLAAESQTWGSVKQLYR